MATQVKETPNNDNEVKDTPSSSHHGEIDDDGDDDNDDKSLIKTDDIHEDSEKKGVLVKDEEREVGDVNYSVYQKWSTTGTIITTIVIITHCN